MPSICCSHGIHVVRSEFGHGFSSRRLFSSSSLTTFSINCLQFHRNLVLPRILSPTILWASALCHIFISYSSHMTSPFQPTPRLLSSFHFRSHQSSFSVSPFSSYQLSRSLQIGPTSLAASANSQGTEVTPMAHQYRKTTMHQQN